MCGGGGGRLASYLCLSTKSNFAIVVVISYCYCYYFLHCCCSVVCLSKSTSFTKTIVFVTCAHIS